MPVKPFIYFVFAPVAVVPMLRQFAKQFGDGGDNELDNFKMELCIDGDTSHTVVAMGGSTGPVGEYTVSILETLINNGTIPSSVVWARVHNEPNPNVLLQHPMLQRKHGLIMVS